MGGDKQGLIAALEECALLMELRGDNPFHCRAIEQGARILEGLEGTPADWIESGRLEGMRGIGRGLIDRVRQWAAEGRIDDLDQLRAEIPAGLLDIHRIPGLGPKKIKQLWKERAIDSVEMLEAAARSGALEGLAGFGKKSIEKILDGIEQRKKYAARHHIDVAEAAARRLLDRLGALAGVDRIECAGSLRRRRETVKDLDLIVTSRAPEEVMKAFVEDPAVERVVAHGPTKSSVLLEGGIPVDLRVVAPDQFAAALMYFTGSKEHNTALRGRARRMGLKLNEYGLYPEDGDAPLPAGDEAAIYKRLGLVCIPPELREDRGEIDAAEKEALPRLIEPDDLRGALHAHSTWSDGKNTIEEMAEACRRRGWRYLGLCDHSQSAAYAGGLRPDALERQSEAIDKLNARLRDFRVFKGIESDILADGRLDYTDAELQKLDLVVASVHSQFNLSREDQTDRICRALEHPATTILGHPTGRLLLRREPFAVDLERVLETAACRGVVIEINANPWRLDLEWTWIRRAKQMGCQFSIGPDAHTTAGLEDVRFGIGIARKGWLEAGDVINTMDPDTLARWLAERRSTK
jgi:DNA polymerase (family 10)